VKILLSSRVAEIVANGREQAREKKIDLAVLRVPGLQVARVLPVARLENWQPGCSIPGWSKHGEGSYRADCLDAAIVKPFAWTEPGSRLVARAYALVIEHEGRLAKGFSGAPAICSQTGEVFAVVATKEGPGTSGSAICISHLMDIWPEASGKVFAPSIAARPTSERAAGNNQTEYSVSSQGAESAKLDIRVAKRRIMEDQLCALLKDYADTERQKTSVLGAAERNRLDRQAAEIWERMEALELKLKDMDLEEPGTD
jgi:hypothetical protein